MNEIPRNTLGFLQARNSIQSTKKGSKVGYSDPSTKLKSRYSLDFDVQPFGKAITGNQKESRVIKKSH